MCLCQRVFLLSDSLLPHTALPGTFEVQLLQVKGPAVVRWLRKLECPLAGLAGKTNPCWRLGLQEHTRGSWAEAAAPAWRGLAPGEDRDTATLLPAPCHFTQIHSLSTKLHSHTEALDAPTAGVTPSLAGTVAKVLCIYLKISI